LGIFVFVFLQLHLSIEGLEASPVIYFGQVLFTAEAVPTKIDDFDARVGAALAANTPFYLGCWRQRLR